MIAFLLTQIAKIKAALTTQSDQIASLIQNGGLTNNETKTIVSATDGAHILVLSRQSGERTVVAITDYWSDSCDVISGSISTGITITKSANSHNITVTNDTGSAIAYLYI